MPAVNLRPTFPAPDRNVTLHFLPGLQGLLASHIFRFGLGILLAAAVARLLVLRCSTGRSRSKCHGTQLCREDYRRRLLAQSFSGNAPGKLPRGSLCQRGSQLRRQAVIWRVTSPIMDEKSRGVSIDGTTEALDQKGRAAHETMAWESRTSSVHDGSDGAAVPGSHATMEGPSWISHRDHGMGFDDAGLPLSGGFASAPRSSNLDFSTPRHYRSRPPPPPPLTPPTLSGRVYTFQDRRPSIAGSIPAELDAISPISFIHQPNPDYTASSSSTADAVSSPVTPRRRSYAKTVPVGIPASTTGPAGQGHPAHFDTPSNLFGPASFPSTLLPPPPPGHDDLIDYQESSLTGLGHGHLHGDREIDMHGEIISVLDDAGAGWKRHTRVYGGGVCLACMASGGGGFYGANVPPEHRR